MSNKGFAVTGIIYTLMVIFIILIITLLAMFNDRKSLLDELKERVLNEVNTYEEALTMTYGPKTFSDSSSNPYYIYDVKIEGYYNFYVAASDASYINTVLYLKEGEKVYIKVGSITYNSGASEISINDPANKVLVAKRSRRYEINEYDNREFIDTVTASGSYSLKGKVEISYASNKRQNTDLNRVRYVRECLYSNSKDERNEWREIKVIKDGVNYAVGKNITGDVTSIQWIVDNILDSRATANSDPENEVCVTIDLGQIYDIDYIYTWHNYSDNRIYYERKLMVSSNNNTYTIVDNYETPETADGLKVSAYEQSKVFKLGEYYYSVKKKDNKTWIRLFHHNNRGGTVLWDSRNQVLNAEGYNNYYKTSGLSFLSNFVRSNGYYELMIEYPELGDSAYITWSQNRNFVNSNDTGTYIGPTSNRLDSTFSGLRKSDSNDTVISSVNNYYHIGALHNSGDGIKGPRKTITGTVDLWVRLN